MKTLDLSFSMACLFSLAQIFKLYRVWWSGLKVHFWTSKKPYKWIVRHLFHHASLAQRVMCCTHLNGTPIVSAEVSYNKKQLNCGIFLAFKPEVPCRQHRCYGSVGIQGTKVFLKVHQVDTYKSQELHAQYAHISNTQEGFLAYI